MTPIEIAVLIMSILAGLLKIHDTVVLKQVRKHVEPKKIFIASDGSIIQSKPPTPQNDADTTQLDIQEEDGRFKQVALFLDTVTGEYFEKFPLQTPRPPY